MAKVSLIKGTKISKLTEQAAVNRLNAIFNEQKENTGLNQTKLANKMGLGQQSAVSQYFLGKVPLNLTAVINFAQALNVSPRDIYPELIEPVHAAFFPRTEINVRCAIAGVPTITSIQSVDVQADLEPYAVQIDVDDYLPYIAVDSFVICSPRVKPQAGAEVFMELQDGSKFICRFLRDEEGVTQIIKLKDNISYDINNDNVKTCDQVIGTHRANNWELR